MTTKEIAEEYLQNFDRYYLYEQIEELTQAIKQYADEHGKECIKYAHLHSSKDFANLQAIIENRPKPE